MAVTTQIDRDAKIEKEWRLFRHIYKHFSPCRRQCAAILRSPLSRTPLDLSKASHALLVLDCRIDWDLVRSLLNNASTCCITTKLRRSVASALPVFNAHRLEFGRTVFLGDIADLDQKLALVMQECDAMLNSPRSKFWSKSFGTEAERTNQTSQTAIDPESMAAFYHGSGKVWGVPVPACGFPPGLSFTASGMVSDGVVTVPLGPGTEGESRMRDLLIAEGVGSNDGLPVSGAVITADGWLRVGPEHSLPLGSWSAGERWLDILCVQGGKYVPAVRLSSQIQHAWEPELKRRRLWR